MIFTRVPNNKAITVAKLSIGETVLFKNSVCMLVSRNGHSFLLDLETGKEVEKVKSDSEVIAIECELTYKVKQ